MPPALLVNAVFNSTVRVVAHISHINPAGRTVISNRTA